MTVRNHLRCDDVQRDLGLLAAGALETDEAASLMRHVGECQACAAELDRWHVVAGALRSLPAVSASDALVARATAAATTQMAGGADARMDPRMAVLLIAFSWAALLASWPMVQFVTRTVCAMLHLGSPTFVLNAVLLLAFGWLTAGVATVALGLRFRGPDHTAPRLSDSL